MISSLQRIKARARATNLKVHLDREAYLLRTPSTLMRSNTLTKNMFKTVGMLTLQEGQSTLVKEIASTFRATGLPNPDFTTTRLPMCMAVTV